VTRLGDFKAFNEIKTDDLYLDISEKKRMRDEQAIRLIKKKFSVKSSKDIGDFELEKKETSVRYLLDKGCLLFKFQE